MKKTLLLTVCLILLAAAFVPVTALAAGTAQTNIYLINPSAIATVGDYLFVADNVSDTESAILCFDVSSDAPDYVYSHNMSKHIVNLATENGKLYAITNDSVIEFTNGSDDSLTLTQSKIFAIENAVDFTYGKNPIGAIGNSEWALTSDSLVYYDGSTFQAFGGITRLNTPKACVVLGDYVYYLYNESGSNTVKSLNCTNTTTATVQLGGLTFAGMTKTASELVLFDANKIFVTDRLSLNGESKAIINSDVEIIDVATSNNRYYALNGKNKVDVYVFNGSSYVKSANSIGSETVDLGLIPDDFDGFTLAKSTGYPTNIIYKTTNAQTSISDVIKDNGAQFIILNFDGANSIPYYYVLVGDKYGWIKKSDGATTPANDAKLAIVDNKISDDVTYQAKFNSLKAVYVHSLPLTSSTTTTFEQSAKDLTKATVLQKFTEQIDNAEKTWYYVSYKLDGATHFGFVESSDVSSFTAVPPSDSIKVEVGERKINSSLFNAVNMYASSAMLEQELLYNDDGNALKLYSGDLVTVIRENDGKSFIQAEKDGTKYFGWIDSANLVGRHNITTNAIFGLVCLFVAIALTVLFVLLFWRKKVIKKKKEEKQ